MTKPAPQAAVSRYAGAEPVGWKGTLAALAVIAATGLALLAAPSQAQDTYTVEIEGDAREVIKPPTPTQRACVSRWRSLHYAAQAADIATTIAAIETGRGVEGNPLVRAIGGKRPNILHLLAIKAPMVGLVEWQANREWRAGDYKGACQSYKIGAIVTGGIAGINLRVFF